MAGTSSVGSQATYGGGICLARLMHYVVGAVPVPVQLRHSVLLVGNSIVPIGMTSRVGVVQNLNDAQGASADR